MVESPSARLINTKIGPQAERRISLFRPGGPLSWTLYRGSFNTPIQFLFALGDISVSPNLTQNRSDFITVIYILRNKSGDAKF